MKNKTVKLEVKRDLIKDQIKSRGCTIKEIADKAGISTNSLSSIINRGDDDVRGIILASYKLFLELNLELEDVIGFADEEGNRLSIKEARKIRDEGGSV